jgi:hypothetical protein
VACARITAFTTGPTPTKVADFLIGGPEVDSFMPGVALDGHGAVFVAWSQALASGAGPISTLASYRLAGDPTGSLRTPVMIAQGTGAYLGHRWGDYLVISADPLDPRGVWIPAPTSDLGGWATSVVRVSEAGPQRATGPDRFASAAAVSAMTFAPGVAVAYIAYAYNYPDALAAAAAAGTVHGPVLLVNTTLPISPYTTAELTRLKPQKIIVVGGPGSVSDAVLGALAPFIVGP